MARAIARHCGTMESQPGAHFARRAGRITRAESFARGHAVSAAIDGNGFGARERIIAMYEAEHRPMLRTYFPQWENKTEFWRIPDLDEMNSENALAQLERNVRALMLALAPAKLFL